MEYRANPGHREWLWRWIDECFWSDTNNYNNPLVIDHFRLEGKLLSLFSCKEEKKSLIFVLSNQNLGPSSVPPIVGSLFSPQSRKEWQINHYKSVNFYQGTKKKAWIFKSTFLHNKILSFSYFFLYFFPFFSFLHL